MTAAGAAAVVPSAEHVRQCRTGGGGLRRRRPAVARRLVRLGRPNWPRPRLFDPDGEIAALRVAASVAGDVWLIGERRGTPAAFPPSGTTTASGGR